jgi:hypothetical protein
MCENFDLERVTDRTEPTLGSRSDYGYVRLISPGCQHVQQAIMDRREASVVRGSNPLIAVSSHRNDLVQVVLAAQS